MSAYWLQIAALRRSCACRVEADGRIGSTQGNICSLDARLRDTGKDDPNGGAQLSIMKSRKKASKTMGQFIWRQSEPAIYGIGRRSSRPALQKVRSTLGYDLWLGRFEVRVNGVK
jgi:hypothetical protein